VVEFGEVNVPDILKSLAIDTWYKVFIALGAVVLVLSLFTEVKGIKNSHAQLVSAGILLIGVGEWKNHKIRAWIKPPNAYTGPAAYIQNVVREPDLVGILFVSLGVILVAIGIWRILHH
jgi:hypothetical protein